MEKNIEALEGAEVINDISPLRVVDMKTKYEKDKAKLVQQIEALQKQVWAFDGAIIACENLINEHTTTDKVEING